jgi:hypothetical protein
MLGKTSCLNHQGLDPARIGLNSVEFERRRAK